MNQKSLYRMGWIAIVLLLGVSNRMAVADSWEASAARRWSSRWQEMERSVVQIDEELKTLPEVALIDHGGTGGMAMNLGQNENPTGHRIGLITIRWNTPVPVDMIALIPALNRDLHRLIADYGLPDKFTVELIGADGNTGIPIAAEDGVRSRALRTGYPFVYTLPEAPVAVGLRIFVFRVPESAGVGDNVPQVAFAECFCFSGEKNVAANAVVRAGRPEGLFPHWNWNPRFLVDGLSPLGLPEVPQEPVKDIGWLSQDYPTDEVRPWVMVDLGTPRTFDRVRIYPVRRPSMGHIPGFGLPQSYVLRVSDTATYGSFKELTGGGGSPLEKAGDNPIEFLFEPVTARFVQFKARKVWKPFSDYPGFLALSEMEVFDGASNIALGAKVISSDQIGRRVAHQDLYWSEESLTDGNGPNGKLLPVKEWLLMLDQRRGLEQQRVSLLAAQEQIAVRIRKWGVGGLVALAFGSLLFALILPFLHRWLRRRAVQRVRTRIAGDLHDEVGSNLGCIQILSDLAKQQAPDSQELSTIRRIAAETVSAVRDIVWLMRARTEERVCIVDHLKESSGILLGSIEWTFEAEESLKTFRMEDDVARDLMLFYREALHNLIRHAQAESVAVSLELNAGKMVLTIQDNGCGMSSEQLNAPSALVALKQRAEQLNGELNIETAPSQGMILTLIFQCNT